MTCLGSGNLGPEMTLRPEMLEAETDGLYVLKTSDAVNALDTGVQMRSVKELLKSSVFDEGLGLVKNYEVRLRLKEGVQPISEPPRRVAFAVKDKLENAITDLLQQKTLVEVKDSPWRTPVVPVLGNGKVRVCGDYTRTLNKVLEVKHHPLDTVEECFSKVAGGKKFSKIDIKQAYNNLMIRKEDQHLTTLNTHMGQLAWTRLPYGLNNSGAIFQETMDKILRGIPMVCCRVDDILVSGLSDEDHLKNLNEVFCRLEHHGLKCGIEKTDLMKEKLVYNGHTVTAEGISPVKSKVEDLKNIPAPKNAKELVTFLSAVGYYRRYIPNMATIIAPLDKLRSKKEAWKWTNVEQGAFEELKKELCSDRTLTCYNPKLPIRVDTDASGVGLGAVISHVFSDGSERPIEYASRTLSEAERRYSQIDKEALGIVWAVQRFHYYVYGRKFTLVTDHQPLVHIFGHKKALPEMSTNRISRWALKLMNYDFEIQYRNTKDHANADMLSRFPCKVQHPKVHDECYELFEIAMEEAYLDAKLVAKETKADPLLSKVAMFVLDGWPHTMENIEAHDVDLSELKCFWNRREQLTLEQGCVTWGNRVVIPQKLRKDVLSMVHATHIGQVGMKSLARSYVYWPRIDDDIEVVVSTCEACSKHGKSMPKVMDHPWVRSTKPMQRVHIDYAGEFQGNHWLLIVDSYSKWPEVIKLGHNTTAEATIKALRKSFCSSGIPNIVVSDNGTQFTSDKFENFMKSNRIKHILCPTYSPKSNGLVERFVQTFKAAMKKMKETSSDIDKNLANFLLAYRNTPHSLTKQPPSVLYTGRTLRSNMHQLRPSDQTVTDQVHPEREEVLLENRTKDRSFVDKQPVWVQPDKEKVWYPATVLRQHGKSPVYDLQYNNRVITKHTDKIKRRIRPVISLKKQNISHEDRARLRSRINQDCSSIPSGPVTRSATRLNSRIDEHATGPSPTPVQEYVHRPSGTLPDTGILRRSERLADKALVKHHN